MRRFLLLTLALALGGMVLTSCTTGDQPTNEGGQIPVGSAEQDDAGSSSVVTITNESGATDAGVIIFQKPTEEGGLDTVAWNVIPAPAQGASTDVDLSGSWEVQVADPYGNTSMPEVTTGGEAWEAVNNGEGYTLQRAGSTSTTETSVRLSDSARGTVTVRLLRNGKLIATKTNVAPGQKAIFTVRPDLQAALAADIQEGDILNAAVLGSLDPVDLSVQSATPQAVRITTDSDGEPTVTRVD